MFSISRLFHTGNGSHGGLGTAAGELAAEARQRLTGTGEELKRQFDDAEDSIKGWVKSNPGWALGAALAAGVVIGWLIKRR
jgi:ElaB/YqjD/DUF883 family membrane-anchored ribosome-binding protein